MHATDTLHRFLFERLNIRGQLVRLDHTWRSLLERRAYPPAIHHILGDTLAATALLGATIKFTGRLVVQLQSTGPLHLVVAQYGHAGTLRGLARWQGEVGASQSLSELCPDGTLIATVEPEQQGLRQDPYQGIVALQNHSVAAALERYFEQSEQLPTRLQLVCNDNTAAGLLIQRMPGVAPDPDGWERIQQLTATLTESELLTLDTEQMLQRLFHQETVRLFDPVALRFECTCSRERTATMLQSLGQDEVLEIIREQNTVGVTCEFCGMAYTFDAEAAASLFAPANSLNDDATRH
jgi:molecular chaperone Hsp33